MLLILAGITVAQLSGNGLFDRTRVAKEKYQNAQDDEDDKIAQYGNEIDSYIDGDRDKFYITKTELLKTPVNIAAINTEIDRNTDIHLEESVENYDAILFKVIVYYNGNMDFQKSDFYMLDNIIYNNTNTRNATPRFKYIYSSIWCLATRWALVIYLA